jgi:hypothetical protein
MALKSQTKWFNSWWFILIIINAILGLIVFELVWKRTIRYRRPIKELNDLFPAFRRNDSVHWKKWLLYPGAVTVMLPRFMLLFVLLMITGFVCKLLTLCTDLNKPMSRVRKNLVRCSVYICFKCISLLVFFNWSRHRYLTSDEADYSEFLGANYSKRVSSSIGAIKKDL